MEETPRANRLCIGVYGRRNAGKSSLINFITRQKAALVSDTPGTTTDPVLKNMELLPLGPVVLIDTAGMDDEGALGELRKQRTAEMMDRTDLALLVIRAKQDAVNPSSPDDFEWLDALKERKIPVLGVLSQIDRVSEDVAAGQKDELERAMGIPFAAVSAERQEGRGVLLEAVVREAPTDFERETILGDLIEPGARVVLVAPQDIQAPKGRLILPQMQTARDILDHGALALFCTTDRLPRMLESLSEPPELVVTDSQVFEEVSAIVPRSVPLTSFSILMARYKGDLPTFVRGARKIRELREDDRVLIAEACTHHPLRGDIARMKLPAWLREFAGPGLEVEVNAGPYMPENFEGRGFSLVIHCGGCMFNRRQLMSRIIAAEAAGVPITNYGVAIAEIKGILGRVTEMFPECSATTLI